MTYAIKQHTTRWGKVPVYDVEVDGENVGTINPIFATPNSDRPKGYYTNVLLEWDALTDETGFPNEYRTRGEAFEAVDDLMARNGISKARGDV